MKCKRVAALYDIHGNVPALEAVLEEVRGCGVDRIVIGGDVVPGPMPVEAYDLLRGVRVPVDCIHGNCERAVLAELEGGEQTLPEQAHAMIRWSARALSEAHATWIRTWPATSRLEIDGVGRVLFCHGTPRSDREIFTRLTPEERLVPIFAGVEADVVVCGHTHMQFDRTIGGVRVINAGSVGMPFGAPGAYWLLLGPDVGLRRTTYDFEKAAERIRATPYPQADDFASNNVLTPPAEATVLEQYTRAGL